jgi:D-alanyl-D-alanine carboxypeptidase
MIMKVMIWALIALSFSCSKMQVASTKPSNDNIEWQDSSARHPKNFAFTSLLNKYVKKGLPGISMIIHDANGTWIGAAGKADIDHEIPFSRTTVSKVASVTKLFIGALVFKVMEDSIHTGLGFSALNKPLSTWLPSKVVSRITNAQRISLGQCMKHESGIADLIDENSFYLSIVNHPDKSWGAEELLEFIYNKPAVFVPGDTAIYSNTNTILVSMVLEYATGEKHADLLRKYILRPLALRNTFYQPHDPLPANTAQGYFDLYNNNTIVNVSNWITGSGNGYGGIYSDVTDMYRFLDALLVKQTLLSPASMAIMQTYGKTDGDNQYGYGIMRKFIRLGKDAGYGHSGRDLGYTANLFYFPEKKVTQALLVNYGTDANSNLKKIFLEFQDELLQISLN